MTNAEALEALEEFVSSASEAVRIGVWAQAFLQEGGEPTWDAVKGVSHAAAVLADKSAVVESFELKFSEIAPF